LGFTAPPYLPHFLSLSLLFCSFSALACSASINTPLASLRLLFKCALSLSYCCCCCYNNLLPSPLTDRKYLVVACCFLCSPPLSLSPTTTTCNKLDSMGKDRSCRQSLMASEHAIRRKEEEVQNGRDGIQLFPSSIHCFPFRETPPSKTKSRN
jgi:hypothetical protein